MAKELLGVLSNRNIKSPMNSNNVRKLIANISGKLESDQLVAATLATPFKIVERPGSKIVAAFFIGFTVPGAGESMAIDIQKNGTTVLSGPFTINATTAPVAKEQVDLMLNITGAPIWNTGDYITVTRTYIAGGTPAPIGANKIVILLSDGDI